jgi:predicted patatin/cPLA2 family phospholipase
MLTYPHALILEGGGLRGNYTAGVLDAFLDHGLEFPCLIGVSAGAGMSCSFVSKQKGRNFYILKNFRNDPRYLSIRSFLKTGDYFGLNFIYHELPDKYTPFDLECFLASPARFISVCTDCETGEPVYLEKGPEILDMMRASSAMPFVSRIVEFGGRKLLDGGISDAIPLKKAISEGYRKNIVILTNPAGYHRKEVLHPPSWLFYRKYPRFIEALKHYVEKYNQSLAFAEEEAAAGRALLIRPSVDLHVSRIDKDVAKLVSLYELGLKDGEAAALKLMSGLHQK